MASSKRAREGMIGQKFSRLTVLREHTSKTKQGALLWVCECECGATMIARGLKLRAGATKSCGCLARDNARRISAQAALAAGGLNYKERNRARLMVWTAKLRAEAASAVANGEVSTISEYRYRAWVLKKYGCTAEKLDALHAQQKGLCAICALPPLPGKRLHVDHDHATGAIRGLLCSSCNLALGCFGDNIMRLVGGIKYLTDHASP